MENAVEALKIAFGVMLFVIALTLSISSFSQANLSVRAITTLRDRETRYTYVAPTTDGNRIVSVETIVPTMYKAYRENIRIEFYKKNGEKLPIYNDLDKNGKPIQNGEINYIDLSEESFGIEGSKTALDVALEHLAIILSGKAETGSKYANEIIYKSPDYANGFYGFLSANKFEEQLGEYYQGENASKIKKRVIKYILQ